MNNNPFPQPICQQIWEGKYRLTTPNSFIPNDESVQDTWRRIANACANTKPKLYGDKTYRMDMETYQHNLVGEFYKALEDFQFLPAGRITAGAGTGRNVTLFNCYVMGVIPDDMGGIFEMLKEAALTMQQGGGIGYDFSPLRPSGAPVKGVDADASGPITFMDVWDSMCRTIMSAGSRRGAMMATMRCDHPDIKKFITAKQDPSRLRMFNVSVLVTDDFMEAVGNDWNWPLIHETAPVEPVPYEIADEFFANSSDPIGHRYVTDIDGKHIYEVVKARDLWDLIMKSTYDQAEPGVLFIDNINEMNNLHYMEDISATNPCGEQPLPPYGACLLGSINLTKMVDNPFTENAGINTGKLAKIAATAVRMLDAVIDASIFPIPQQEAEAKEKRRMGIGITGLADMLFMMGITYGSEEAANISENVMKLITLACYQESIQLAREFGPCPATETKEQRIQFVQSGFMQNMPSSMRDEIIQVGIRNALLTSVAPTGTISMYAGNVSSGIEPIFAPRYTRKILEDDGVTRREEVVEDYAVMLYREHLENNGATDDELNETPFSLVTAQTLTPHEHLVIQAAVQKWVDSSISKTINCPEDISFDDFKAIYTEAYNSGCKGCTTYRPNDVTGSVLYVETEPKEEQTAEPEKTEGSLQLSGPTPRNTILDGQTYKLKWQNSNFYVTINNHTNEDGVTMPFEIFINSQHMANFQWTVALTRMMSSVFRRGGDVSFVVEDLKSILDPSGGDWVDGKYVPSFIAFLGDTIEQHLISLDPMRKENTTSLTHIEKVEDPEKTPAQCPECRGFNTHLSGGCPVCTDCGYSKCG